MIFRLLDFAFGFGVDYEKLRKQLEDYATARMVPSNTSIIAEFSSLDSKSSSLLQHLSIMIASLSVSYTTNPPENLKIVVLINIFFYLLCIFLTLRVIANVDYTSDPSLELKLARELKIRERYYALAHSIASLLTFFLVISIIAVVVYYKQ